MPTLSLNHAHLYYVDHRSREMDNTLLFIHGSASSHAAWPESYFDIPGTRAVALDLPGHGRSSPPGRRTIAHYAAVVEAFAAVLELNNLILVGHSMGSAIALTIAFRSYIKLRGLILLGASARMPVHNTLLTGALSSPESVADFIAGNGLGQPSPALQAEIRRGALATEATTVLGDFMACNRFDLRPNLAAIDTPTLIIAGELDAMTPLRFSQSLAAGLPRARLITLQGVGHYAMLEMTVEVRDLIINSIET